MHYQAELLRLLQLITPLCAGQRHAPAGRTALVSGLAKGRRQVDGQPSKVTVEREKAVCSLDIELQLIGQFAAQWQRLADRQPIQYRFQGGPALYFNACALPPGAALSTNAATHLMFQNPRRHRLSTESLGQVKVEIALDAAQRQHRIAQLQTGILAAKGHLYTRRGTGCQRDIQLQLGAQRALTTPVGKILIGNRRLAQRAQGIFHTAVQIRLKQQTRYLPGGNMRHSGHCLADPTVMQLAATDAHLHTAVFDPDFTGRLAQSRPARLIIQLCLADLEVEANTAGGRVCTFHQ